jgi:hypothetical protein
MTLNKLLGGMEGALTHDAKDIINHNLVDIGICSTELDVTSSTTLTAVPGMLTDTRYGLIAGKQYQFRATISGTSDSAGGMKIGLQQLNGLTLSQFECVAKGFTASAVAVQHVTSTTSNASLFAATGTYIYVELEGTFTVLAAPNNGSGSQPGLQLTFAQNVSDSTASSVYVGSKLIVAEATLG